MTKEIYYLEYSALQQCFHISSATEWNSPNYWPSSDWFTIGESHSAELFEGFTESVERMMQQRTFTIEDMRIAYKDYVQVHRKHVKVPFTRGDALDLFTAISAILPECNRPSYSPSYISTILYAVNSEEFTTLIRSNTFIVNYAILKYLFQMQPGNCCFRMVSALKRLQTDGYKNKSEALKLLDIKKLQSFFT